MAFIYGTFALLLSMVSYVSFYGTTAYAENIPAYSQGVCTQQASTSANDAAMICSVNDFCATCTAYLYHGQDLYSDGSVRRDCYSASMSCKKMNAECWAQVVFGNSHEVKSGEINPGSVPGSLDFRDGNEGTTDWVCGDANTVQEPFGLSLFTYYEDL